MKTDPLIYACLEELRDKMLIIRSDSGVKIVEETIKEIQRLNKELELHKSIMNERNKNWEVTPKSPRPLEYGDHLL